MPTPSRLSLVIGLLIALVVVNGAATWFVVAQQQQQVDRANRVLNAMQASINEPANGATSPPLETSPQPSPQPAPITSTSSTAQKLADLAARITVLEQKKTTTTTKVVASQDKDFVIFLGSGMTSSRDWTTIPGASVAINPQNYPPLTAVHFEAAMSILGGEAHARLVNTSTNEVFYSSEIMQNTSTDTWVSSNTFATSLPAGQYSVQLKSTSGEAAVMSGARLRLTTK